MVEAKAEAFVGGDLKTFLREVGNRWEAAAAGERVEPSQRIVFRDWAALQSSLTPKRMALLDTLHSAPAEGVRPLARLLGRDVKRVHSDIAALEELGIVSRDTEGRITVEVDQIRSTITIGKRLTSPTQR